MRFGYILGLLFIGVTVSAQHFYPIKIEQKWGLIDNKGNVVLNPIYDAIGEFQTYGYAVIQQDALVGLIDQQGQEILPIQYDDIKILDSTLIAVVTNNAWKVVNLNGQIILDGNYESVKTWRSEFIGFQKKGKWGVANINGKLIVSPNYDDLTLRGAYFQTELNGKFGLIDLKGKTIINPIASQIIIYNDDLFFYKKEKLWGAVDRAGGSCLGNNWSYFERLDKRFIKLYRVGGVALYAIETKKIITKGLYRNFFPFQRDKVLAKKYNELCLIDAKGNSILSCSYDEIKPFQKNLYRVRQNTKWGVLNENEKVILPFKYDYISPLNKHVCIVREGNRFGIANFKGELLTKTLYTKIKLNNNQAGAYQGEKFTSLSFNEKGELKNESKFDGQVTIKIGKRNRRSTTDNFSFDNEAIDYTLDDYEWFYSAGQDKWGLRSIETGEIRIEPSFDNIMIRRDLGFTVVGVERIGRQKIDRTNFRFNVVYGVVNNKEGRLVTELNLWDIRMEDFEKKLNIARCIFAGGKHGLIRKDGKIVLKEFTYIGEFEGNRARVARRGALSGEINPPTNHLGYVAAYLNQIRSPNEMSDFTLHDEEFISDAVLTCENSNWGYIDTAGNLVTELIYQFARDFKNGAGMVQKRDKWGLIGEDGITILAYQFDDIHFLTNTNEQIFRVYINNERYGLIDTSGRAVIPVQYEDIGDFGEGLVPVKRNGLWGFANKEGEEIIDCIYDDVLPFSEGLAGVKKNRNWGFINEQNEIIIPIKHKRIGNFKEGVAWVKNGFYGGYMNQQGEMVIEEKFEGGQAFEDGIARVRVDNQYGLINLNGNYVFSPKYFKISAFNKHGIAISQLPEGRRKYGLINRKGERLLIRRYTKIEPFSEGLAAIRQGEKWGFIDTLGNVAIEPIFSKVLSFSQGRAAVRQNGRWGFIDRKGMFTIEPQFSKCLNYNGGKAVVYKGYRNAGLIDLEGNYVIEPSVYKMVGFSNGRGLVRNNNYQWYYITEENRLYKGYYQHAGSFQDGVAPVKLDGKWGLINEKGIELISPKYDKVGDFENGYAKVRIKRFTGVVNLNGEIIVEPTYEYISYSGDGVFRVEQGDQLGYFDQLGNWIWELAR